MSVSNGIVGSLKVGHWKLSCDATQSVASVEEEGRGCEAPPVLTFSPTMVFECVSEGSLAMWEMGCS